MSVRMKQNEKFPKARALLIITFFLLNAMIPSTNAVSNLQFHHYQSLNQFQLRFMIKRKWSKARILYYANTSVSHKILLQASDVELNAGPAIKCQECSKTI